MCVKWSSANLLNDETLPKSNSTKAQRNTETEDILTDKQFFEKESTESSKTNKIRKVGIGRKHKKSSQGNASIQQISAPNDICSNISQLSSKSHDNKSRAKYKKYNESESGKERARTYLDTKQGKIAAKKACKSYSKTEKGKAKQMRYTKTEQGKIAAKRAYKSYTKTEHGKIAAKIAYKSYTKTEKGKAKQIRYTKTDQGKKAQKTAYTKYVQTDQGKKAQKTAYTKYVHTDQGKNTRNTAENKYNKTNKRHISQIDYRVRKK